MIVPSRLCSASTRTLSTWTSCPNADLQFLFKQRAAVTDQGVAFTCGRAACSFLYFSCWLHADHQSHKLWKPPHMQPKPNYSGTQKSNSCLRQQAELLPFYDNYLVKIDHFNASSRVFWLTSFGLGCWTLFIENEKYADYKGKQSV